MKIKLFAILISLNSVVLIQALGQPAQQREFIESHTLAVTFNKTSSIVFPAVIKSIDRGSRDLLVQKAKGVGNVLQLKAAKGNLQETNLTVISADGILRHFTVTYADKPASLILDLRPSSKNQQTPSLIFQNDLTEMDMENYSASIVKTKKSHSSIEERNHQMNFVMVGIYIKDEVMFFHFRINNKSNINYDAEVLKFYTRDKVKVKRTASQELEMTPIYIYGDSRTIKAKSKIDFVYAFGKFTIPESKFIEVEMFERNGGRNFDLAIKSKTLIKAHPLH